MRRLSACAQGAKRIDSKASMSALGWLHQEGGARQCGAVSRSASGSKHVQGRSASESGHAVSLLTAARVSSITRHRAAVLRVIQGEAMRGQRERGKLFVRVSCAAALCASGKTGTLLRPRCCRFCSRTKFDFGFDSCSYRKFSYASVKGLRLSESGDSYLIFRSLRGLRHSNITLGSSNGTP